jgi:hypothetical protein
MANASSTIEREASPRALTALRGRLRLLGLLSLVAVVALFLYSGGRNINETQQQLRLIPWLAYDQRVDFNYFYGAATVVWSGEARDIYPNPGELTFYQFDPAFRVVQDEYIKARMITRGNYYNPPALAFMLSPLAAFPFREAFWIFSAFSITALVAFVGVSWKAGRHIPEMPLLVLGIFAFKPVHEAVIMGHMSLFFVLALGGGFLALRARQPVLAGMILALLFLKPQWAVLPAGLLFFRGEWRALAAMCGLGAVYFSVPFIITGWESFTDYVYFLRWSQSIDVQNAPHMFSWNGFFYKVDATTPSPWLVYGFTLATIIPILIVWRGGDLYLGVAVAIVGMLLISTRSVWYDWAFLVVAATFLILRTANNGYRIQAWIILLALHVAAGQSTAALLAPDRHLIGWHEPAFYSLTWVAFAAVLWMAFITIKEGLFTWPRLPRFSRLRPSPS